MNKRSVYILITILCFVMCLIILKCLSNHQFIRGFFGDIVITILIYSFVKIFIDINSLKLCIFVLIFSFAIEIMQLLRVIDYIGLGESKSARIILGATFDFRDLMAYSIGTILIYLFDKKFLKAQ